MLEHNLLGKRRLSPCAALALLLAAGVAGCTGTLSVGPMPDAGTAPDAGTPLDAGAPGDAGADAGPDAGPGNDAGPPIDAGPLTFQPVSIDAAVNKAKNLLVGLPATDAEVAAVAADPNALSRLLAQWIATPQYNAKMLAFFATAFQQTEVTAADFGPQFNQDIPYPRNAPQIMQDYQESFARTALELIAEQQPFTSTMTTRSFMMTPALMAAYALIDAVSVDDLGKVTDHFAKNTPTAITLESAQAVSIADAINPSSPSYMHFYDPAIATSYDPACPVGTNVYPSPASARDLAQIALSRSPFVYNYVAPGQAPHRCSPPPIPSVDAYVIPSDYTAWKMVTVRAPSPGEATTRFYDLPTLRTSTELVLHVSRVGYFTTPSFLAQWATNQSNQARVTLNQTLIVGLGQPIDTTNLTAPQSLAALDSQHAAPGSVCYACHQSLDPMRQFFRQAYTLSFSPQGDASEASMQGQFAFQGVSVAGTSIFDLGTQLAAHPMFAAAWVQRLCTYANSGPCDPTDPEFLRLVSVFSQSHYSWNALVQALFSSPITTYLSDTQSADNNGQVFPVARQEHLCAMLSNRLSIHDVCGLDSSTVVPAGLKTVQAIAASWPADQYSRGNPTPVLANSPSLFMRAGMENLCAALATYLIDNNTTGQWKSTDPTSAIHDFTTGLMGLNSDRAAQPQALLQAHFNSALGSGASTALKSTFVVACLSPYVIGIGQ